MAATITTLDSYGKVPTAPAMVTNITIVPDTSYPAGGYAVGLTARLPKGATVAATVASYVVISTGAAVADGRAVYNEVTDKIQIFAIGTPAEASGDLSLNRVDLTVFSY
jgi:hypothetical protein